MYPPKRTRFKKYQKGRLGNIESNHSIIRLGRYAIVSLQSTRLKATTIEAVRRAINRKLKRVGQIFVSIHPALAVTSKPLEVRMGKGKGSLSFWACRIKAGQILYEIDGVPTSLAKQAYLLANSKLPMKTVFVLQEM